MSQVTFTPPCHIRSLLDLPPGLRGLQTIPDSVEFLQFSTSSKAPEYAVGFERDSKLVQITTRGTRSFLHISSATVKRVRSRIEFNAPKGNRHQPVLIAGN
jgi:hypothetical protein